MTPQPSGDGALPPNDANTLSNTSTPLRVCCYGSSSSSTPRAYLNAAYDLGYTLAIRDHTCVNGGGAWGCMASMNSGARDGKGRIVGVIHKMFLVDGGDDDTANNVIEGCHPVFNERRESGGRVRIVVADGDDLRERKRLLVEDADGIVVLPGGPGTWDELWEMVCARNVGLTTLPIVCVNVNGFYDSFRDILRQAYEETMVKNHPDDLVTFVSTAEEAVEWIEKECDRKKNNTVSRRRTDNILMRKGSVMAPPVGVERRGSFLWFLNGGNSFELGDKEICFDDKDKLTRSASLFIGGVILGYLASGIKFRK